MQEILTSHAGRPLVACEHKEVYAGGLWLGSAAPSAWVPALGFLKPVSPSWPKGPLGLVATVLPAGPFWAYTMNEVDLQVQTPNHWSLGTYCVLTQTPEEGQTPGVNLRRQGS